MTIVVGGVGAGNSGSGAISGGFKIFELMFNQTTDAALPVGTYRPAVFTDKASMQAYFTKHTTEFDRLKTSGRVCEIGTIDAQGKPLTINNEAYSYVEGGTDPWVDVVGGLIGPKGDTGAAIEIGKGGTFDAVSKIEISEGLDVSVMGDTATLISINPAIEAVKSVDGVKPDNSGNVQINSVRSRIAVNNGDSSTLGAGQGLSVVGVISDTNTAVVKHTNGLTLNGFVLESSITSGGDGLMLISGETSAASLGLNPNTPKGTKVYYDRVESKLYTKLSQSGDDFYVGNFTDSSGNVFVDSSLMNSQYQSKLNYESAINELVNVIVPDGGKSFASKYVFADNTERKSGYTTGYTTVQFEYNDKLQTDVAKAPSPYDSGQPRTASYALNFAFDQSSFYQHFYLIITDEQLLKMQTNNQDIGYEVGKLEYGLLMGNSRVGMGKNEGFTPNPTYGGKINYEGLVIPDLWPDDINVVIDPNNPDNTYFLDSAGDVVDKSKAKFMAYTKQPLVNLTNFRNQQFGYSLRRGYVYKDKANNDELQFIPSNDSNYFVIAAGYHRVGYTGIGESTTFIDWIDARIFDSSIAAAASAKYKEVLGKSTFSSEEEMKAYFTVNPQELKSNMSLMVSKEDSSEDGAEIANEVVLLQWTGEDSPSEFNESFLVGASLTTGVSSLSLGEAHKFSSGGQNVFTINQASKSAFAPPWSEIGDHSTEAGRFVNSRPKSREYGELEYLEIAGSVADSGAIDYNVSGENPENQSLLGIELVAAEAYSGRLSYDIKEAATGKLVYKQTFNVDIQDGDLIDWWFKYPVDSLAGDDATAELLKADKTFLKVRPSQTEGEAYRKLKRRKFEIKELAYSGENAGDSDTIRTERILDKDNENNSLVFNLNDVTVLNAEHAVSFRSTDRVSSKIKDVDKFVVTESENDSYSDLNMNTHEITNLARATTDYSAPNFEQVKEFVSNHTGGRSEILVTASEDVQQYDIGVAQVGLDHIQMFTATTENKTLDTSLQFFIPLDDDFLQNTIVEFSKRYFKGVDAEVRYFNNRSGQFIIQKLDDSVFAIQKEGLNGWDVIEASDVPNPDQAIGWAGDGSGVHGHVLYAEADDGSTAKSDSEVTIGTIKQAQLGVVANAGTIGELSTAFGELAQDVTDNKNVINITNQSIESQFKLDEVLELESLGITDDQLHAHHGDKTELAKVFKMGGVRIGHNYVLRMNQYAGKDLHGFLPNTLGGLVKVTSVNANAHRDHEMNDIYLPPVREHRVIFEFFDVAGDIWHAFADADDTFTDFTRTDVPSDLQETLEALRSDVDGHENRITTNEGSISTLETNYGSLDAEVAKVESVLGLPYAKDLTVLGITTEELTDAADSEAILQIFRSKQLSGSTQFKYELLVEVGDDFYNFLPNALGGVFTVYNYNTDKGNYTLAQYMDSEGRISKSFIPADDSYINWRTSSGGDSSLRQEFEEYKTATNATIQRLEETIGTLETLVDTAFWKQELTYFNNVLKSEMTNIKGDKSDQTVTIVGSGGQSEVPENFNVYVGWDTNDAITSVEILDLADTANGKAAIASSKDTLIGQSFATTRDNTNYKYSYIAFPKDAVSPDPSLVDYLNGSPASWERHEVVIDNLIYVVLRPEWANDEDDLSMVLSQE